MQNHVFYDRVFKIYLNIERRKNASSHCVCQGASFQDLSRDIVDAIESIPEMGLKGKGQVKIIYPEFESNTDKTVVAEVRILDLPQRTEKVRGCLMAAVSRAIEKHCPKKDVLCTISLLQEKQGFCFLGAT